MIDPTTIRAPYRPKLELPREKVTLFDRMDRRLSDRVMDRLLIGFLGLITWVAVVLVYFWWTA